MITREQLRRAKPSIDTATYRYIKGDISREEYERRVAEERRAMTATPPGTDSREMKQGPG